MSTQGISRLTTKARTHAEHLTAVDTQQSSGQLTTADQIQETTRQHGTLLGAQHREALRAHTRFRKSEQTELLRISQAVAGSLDLQTILREIAESSLGMLGAEASGIYLWRHDTEDFEVGFEATIPEWPGVLEPGTIISSARFPTMIQAMKTGQAYTVRGQSRRLSDAEKNRYLETGVGSVLCLPMILGGSPIGCFKLFTREDREFSNRDIQLGEELAFHAAMAINNAQLLAESIRIAEERASMLLVGQAAISSLELSTVLSGIAQAALGIGGAERCRILLWSPGADEVEIAAEAVAPDWVATSISGSFVNLDECELLQQMLETKTPLVLDSAETTLETCRDCLFQDSAQSWTLVPLLIGSDCYGAIQLCSRKHRTFGSLSIRLGQEIAAFTALAIQNARLLEQAQRTADEQASLLDISQAAIEGASFPVLLDQIAQAGLMVDGVESSQLALWQPGKAEIEIASAVIGGANPSHRVEAAILLNDLPLMREAMESGELRSFLIDDPMVSPSERSMYAVGGMRSVLIVPLMFGTECFGCLLVLSSQRRRFSKHAERFGRDLAAQAAQIMDRARLFDAIQQRANTDGVTSLLNHRAIVEALDHALVLARSTNSSLSIMLIDLDDFKLFNDTHGHLIGDRVLAEAADQLRSSVRPTDFVARYGGDEFLIVMPDTDAGEVRRVATQVTDRFTRTTVKIGQRDLPLRLSIGVATFPEDGRTRQTLIAHADGIMYAMKQMGGDKTGSIGTLVEPMEATPYSVLIKLVDAVDRKDRFTLEHSRRTALLAVRFGQELGLSPEELDALEIASRLQNVGKIVVPDSVLRKPGPLNNDEELSLRQHVAFSSLMVQGVPHQAAVQSAIANHHERWDGTGYPNKLRGEEIPLLARILGLVSAFVAMSQDRPFRQGQTKAQAVAELRRQAGRQFDPELVEPFITLVKSLDSEMLTSA